PPSPFSRFSLLLHGSADHRDLPSFPTRRSSDLRDGLAVPVDRAPLRLVEAADDVEDGGLAGPVGADECRHLPFRQAEGDVRDGGDRKSIRLNSSHVKISYAVFCLKKKKRCNE